MREKNPDMVAGKKQKFVMRPPQVVRIGTKKTSFANFTEVLDFVHLTNTFNPPFKISIYKTCVKLQICKTLHRQPKHLLDFLLAELGTSGSVDGNSQLIIKGRFQQKQIENVLRRYIKEYVTCHTCRSPDTILQKDTRLFFLQCETCGSRCSVASIKSGFQVFIDHPFYPSNNSCFSCNLRILFLRVSGCYWKTCCHSSENGLNAILYILLREHT